MEFDANMKLTTLPERVHSGDHLGFSSWKLGAQSICILGKVSAKGLEKGHQLHEQLPGKRTEITSQPYEVPLLFYHDADGSKYLTLYAC